MSHAINFARVVKNEVKLQWFNKRGIPTRKYSIMQRTRKLCWTRRLDATFSLLQNWIGTNSKLLPKVNANLCQMRWKMCLHFRSEAGKSQDVKYLPDCNPDEFLSEKEGEEDQGGEHVVRESDTQDRQGPGVSLWCRTETEARDCFVVGNCSDFHSCKVTTPQQSKRSQNSAKKNRPKDLEVIYPKRRYICPYYCPLYTCICLHFYGWKSGDMCHMT